jgi:hypothetical protein
MRTYRKRSPQVQQCVHCKKDFVSTHKRTIYCGDSCGTLAYYARKAQADPPPVTPSPDSAPLASPLLVETAARAEPPPAVTLAVNAQNLAWLATAPLLTEGIKQVAQFVGKLIAPTPQAGPSTWLPLLFRLLKEPLVTFQHVEWDEPRFFVPVEWGGTVFYYRAKQDLLFWQAPDGQCYQLTRQAEFQAILARLRAQQLPPANDLTRPPGLLKEVG